jgi:dTDP-4-amino-4,6-dideoxygalactose transaminase
VSQRLVPRNIPFIDLQSQRRRLGDRIDAAIARVLRDGRFILGPEVAQLERELSGHCGARHTVACANGTDALVLALMALEVGPGDAVIVPSFTFCATAEAPALAGATPVFADVRPDTYNIDLESAARAFRTARDSGLRPRGIIGVDLFGLLADYAGLSELASEHDAWVIDDAAQAFGATSPSGNAGALARISTTSFYPAKPLGCYGDGGAVLTDDDDLAARLRSLRVHGEASHRYDNVLIGQNSRLDTLQAAILLQKLTIFDAELVERQGVAQRYSEGLADSVVVPRVPDGYTSTWAQYTLLCEPGRRPAIQAALKERGVPTAVYYPKPLHRQTAYRDYPTAGDLAVSDDLSERAFSLPMHPYLEAETQDYIVGAVREAVAAAG